MAGARQDPHERVHFSVGDRVVHPHHGAGEIVGMRRGRVLGQVGDYITIRIAHIGMDVIVPSANAWRIGLRPVISEREAARVVRALARRAKYDPERWNARVKHYRERAGTGDVFELAAVLRDLAACRAADHLTAPERDLHERVRRMLCSELAYALEVEREEADARVDRALAAHSRRAREQPDGGTRVAFETAA
jgi:CarD family transcriptional regulator